MQPKNLFLNLLILLTYCLIFVGCHKKKPEEPNKKNDQPAVVDVIIAGNQSISSTVEANGSIIANEFVELHAEVSGRITYLNIPEGSSVEKGTILARINDADLQAQLNKTKVQLELAQKKAEDSADARVAAELQEFGIAAKSAREEQDAKLQKMKIEYELASIAANTASVASPGLGVGVDV